jgi:hypothetical protein
MIRNGVRIAPRAGKHASASLRRDDEEDAEEYSLQELDRKELEEDQSMAGRSGQVRRNTPWPG